MRTLGVALCLFIGFASPAYAESAESDVYLGGVVFADLQRASGESDATASIGFTGVTKLDGTSVGGGIRGGAFLAPRWSLELAVDLGATIDKTATPQIVVPLRSTTIVGGVTNVPPSAFFLPQLEEHVASRTTATSVLVAYHPPSRRHIRAGFGGGLSFMHTAIVETVRYTFVGQGTILPPIPSPSTTRIETVANQMAATVGGELAFELARRAAVVAEIRAHGFDSRFVIRPGVGVRWRW